MANFIQRLFFKAEKSNEFPKISFGAGLEFIEYKTANNYLDISLTTSNGLRLYADSIQKWRNNELISDLEKESIFIQIIQFLVKKTKERPIVVINIDYNKTLWETLCEKYKDQVKQIEYTSDKERDEFLFNHLLASIRKNGTIVDGNKIIKTEAEFLEYWKNRNKG